MLARDFLGGWSGFRARRRVRIASAIAARVGGLMLNWWTAGSLGRFGVLVDARRRCAKTCPLLWGRPGCGVRDVMGPGLGLALRTEMRVVPA